MKFEEYLSKYQGEVGTGPLKYLTARETLIGEILWGAATAAEREKCAKYLETHGCPWESDMIREGKHLMEANDAPR